MTATLPAHALIHLVTWFRASDYALASLKWIAAIFLSSGSDRHDTAVGFDGQDCGWWQERIAIKIVPSSTPKLNAT